MPYVNIRVTREGVTFAQKQKLIAATTRMLQEVLGKDPYSTFVVIDEVETDNWGWQGKTVSELQRQQPAGGESAGEKR